MTSHPSAILKRDYPATVSAYNWRSKKGGKKGGKKYIVEYFCNALGYATMHGSIGVARFLFEYIDNNAAVRNRHVQHLLSCHVGRRV